jgi:hypothetical protein
VKPSVVVLFYLNVKLFDVGVNVRALLQDVIELFALLYAPFAVPRSFRHNFDAIENLGLTARKEKFADKGTTREIAPFCLRMIRPRFGKSIDNFIN